MFDSICIWDSIWIWFKLLTKKRFGIHAGTTSHSLRFESLVAQQHFHPGSIFEMPWLPGGTSSELQLRLQM